MLGSISCAPEDTRSDSEKYPNIPSFVFDFFDATIFQNKNNKIEYVSDIRKNRKGKFRYQFPVVFGGSFKPELTGYLAYIDRSFQIPPTNSIRTIERQEQNSEIMYFGLKDNSMESIKSAYISYKNFIGDSHVIELPEFIKTDFNNTCFIQRINQSDQRKTFAAILYDRHDGKSYEYKERVVSCYLGSMFVQMGVWPFPQVSMKKLVYPSVLYQKYKNSLDKDNNNVSLEELENETVPSDKTPMYMPLSDKLQWAFLNDAIYEGMDREEFYQMMEDIYTQKIELRF